MELQTFLDDTTHAIQNARTALANATTPAEYAQAGYDHLEVIRQLCNQANEGGTQVEEFAGMPA